MEQGNRHGPRCSVVGAWKYAGGSPGAQRLPVWTIQMVVMRAGSGNPGRGKNLSQGMEVWDLSVGEEAFDRMMIGKHMGQELLKTVCVMKP